MTEIVCDTEHYKKLLKSIARKNNEVSDLIDKHGGSYLTLPDNIKAHVDEELKSVGKMILGIDGNEPRYFPVPDHILAAGYVFKITKIVGKDQNGAEETFPL